MKLLCWMVLASLLVESFQKPGVSIETVTTVSKTATDQEEGSGGSSESKSEEHTEAIPERNEKKMEVLILPDESAPPSSNETNSDSDETIRRALSSNKSKQVESSALKTSSDLIDLGESVDNSASHPEKSHGKEPPQAEEPSPVRSYLFDGKLRAEIDDRIQVSPTPGDSHAETSDKHSQPHREPPLNDEKSGLVIDEGKLSDTLHGDSHERIPDGKSGKVVSGNESKATSPTTAASPPAAFDLTTGKSTGRPETTVSVTPTTVHSHEATTLLDSSSTAASGKTHAPVKGDTHASTESPTEPSSTLSDVTTVSLSSSTHSSVEMSTEHSHKSNAMNIYDFNEHVFQKDAVAVWGSTPSSSENLAKLQCSGPYCDTPVETVTCEPVANLTLENKTSSLRYAIPIQWTCGSLDFEPEFHITKSTVVCEGYDYPGDPWIVKDSCVLIFQLDRFQSSPLTREDDKGQDNSIIAIILSMLAVTGLGYLAIKAVILKRRHGYWVPSYCAVPLKDRMGFRRKRQTDFEEEPVNVHFDMGEEKTNIGRTRIRSYGSK